MELRVIFLLHKSMASKIVKKKLHKLFKFAQKLTTKHFANKSSFQ